MLTRVSNIEAYRQWMNWAPLHEDDVEPTVEDFIRFITTDEPSEKMRVGTAFHAAIEAAQDGNHDTFSAHGYTFLLPDAEIVLPAIREQRVAKDYGALKVTGKADCVEGKIVYDHKTTSKVDLDRYMDGYQWRYYLDLFEADVFQWNVFQIYEAKREGENVYRVAEPQVLRAYRYPELQQDCVRLAEEFLEFATRMNLPDARLED